MWGRCLWISGTGGLWISKIATQEGCIFGGEPFILAMERKIVRDARCRAEEEAAYAVADACKEEIARKRRVADTKKRSHLQKEKGQSGNYYV